MKLYTYYQPVKEITGETEMRLVNVWRRHHEGLGFEPMVLNEWHAMHHPYFIEYEAKIKLLPNTNPDGYERACFMRWLALAQVGGGMQMDYDCFWLKPPPATVPLHSPHRLRTYEGQVPSCVAADPSELLSMCKLFATGKIGQRGLEGKPHYSDMYCLEDLMTAGTPWIESFKVARHYGVEGWKDAPLVHFPHVAMVDHGPRWRAIPDLLKQHSAYTGVKP